MKKSDLVHLNWTSSSGNETRLPHYGVVLTVAKFNDLIPRVVVAPVTSKFWPQFSSLRVPVDSENSNVTGFVCLDHIRTVDPEKRNLKKTGKNITPRCSEESNSLSSLFHGYSSSSSTPQISWLFFKNTSQGRISAKILTFLVLFGSVKPLLKICILYVYNKPVPCIYIFKNLKLYIYFNDHNPPHIHIISKNGSAAVEINSLKVVGGKGLTKTELKMGLTLIEKN